MTLPRSAVLSLVLLAVTLSCQSSTGPAATSSPAAAVSHAPLHPLDEENAAAFRKAFDDGRAHDRYIVALSPT